MSKFESKPLKQRCWLIWKAITARKYLIKKVLILTVFYFAILVILSLIADIKGENLIPESSLPKFVFYLIFLVVAFVTLFLMVFFVKNLEYLQNMYFLTSRSTFAVILIAPPKITLRKRDGVEKIIYDEDIKRIYFLDNNERNNLLHEIEIRSLYKIFPIFKNIIQKTPMNDSENKAVTEINLEILTIETKNGDHSIVLDVYDDAKQIVAELSDLYPIENLDEYMKKSSDEILA